LHRLELFTVYYKHTELYLRTYVSTVVTTNYLGQSHSTFNFTTPPYILIYVIIVNCYR